MSAPDPNPAGAAWVRREAEKRGLRIERRPGGWRVWGRGVDVLVDHLSRLHEADLTPFRVERPDPHWNS